MSRAASLQSPLGGAETGTGPRPGRARRGGAPRVVFWGTYDLGKPRTRILLEGLAEAGVEVAQIHGTIWPDHADKSQLGAGAFARALLRAILWYPILVVRFLLSPRDATIVVPYPGPLDVLVLHPFARARGQRIVWDMFLSLYDTVANDRQMVSRTTLAARLLRRLERRAALLADPVLLDTGAHAAHVTRLLELPPGRTAAVPVGAETARFPRLAPPVAHGGRPRVLFYGQLIPLHGIETILAAALSERGRQIDWHIVGTGQDRPKVEAALARGGAGHVTWDDWVPYDRLIEAIGAADICLGIFGASDKAASVVPNKVYQTLMAGRAVITRASPAMAETFGETRGLTLVPHSDPDALLDAIDAVAAQGCPPMPAARLAIARPRAVAERFLATIAERGAQPLGEEVRA